MRSPKPHARALHRQCGGARQLVQAAVRFVERFTSCNNASHEVNAATALSPRSAQLQQFRIRHGELLQPLFDGREVPRFRCKATLELENQLIVPHLLREPYKKFPASFRSGCDPRSRRIAPSRMAPYITAHRLH